MRNLILCLWVWAVCTDYLRGSAVLHACRLLPFVYVFFILDDSDSSAVALNSLAQNKIHIPSPYMNINR